MNGSDPRDAFWRRFEESLALPVVLLAEDDAEMRKLLRAALEAAGYRVREAWDGQEALRPISALGGSFRSAFAPDVVVADIRMPHFSGLELLEAVRVVDPSLPVILITAFGDEETHAEARRLGVTAVFDKPFEIRSLVETVRCVAPPDAWA
jgi:DNA-binding response OmpR family regulator